MYYSSMATTNQESMTLYDLRISHGKTHQQIVNGVAQFLKEEPKNWSASAQWEVRGIKDADILDALASVYGLDSSVIRQVAKNSRNQGRPALNRGRRKVTPS
jgi:hypothetical protein